MQAQTIPLTADLLRLTEKSYDQYNGVLSEIKRRLPLAVQVETFEKVLGEELPLTTVRRAFRTAIRVAMGEKDVFREPRPTPSHKNKKLA